MLMQRTFCVDLNFGQARQETSGPTSGRNGDGRQWSTQLSLMRSELGVSQQYQPWAQMGLTIDGMKPSPRVLAIINYVVAMKIKEANAANVDGAQKKVSRQFVLESIQNTFIDISQNPCRKAWTPKHGTNHTLTTVTQLIHLGACRAILPAEEFFFQGHNPSRIRFPNVKNKVLKELAGEGMFLGSLATILWAMYLLGAFDVHDDLGFEMVDL